MYDREDRPDGHDIWRVASDGGPAERLTRNGGLLAREWADGQTLFYTQRDDTSPLFSLLLAGGPERQVADCALSRSLADGPDGIYYLGCPVGQPDPPLYRLDPATGRSRLLGKVQKGGAHPQLAVSPNGQAILFVKWVDEGADLFLIEDFR
jgi:Tol biopolymer transport system component